MTTLATMSAPVTEPASTPQGAIIDDAAIRQVEPVLMGFAYRAVRREDVARDLVQETYIAALEGKASFAGRSTLRTWMVGILSRKIIDFYRRTRREVLMDLPPEPDPLGTFAPATTRAPDSHLDPALAMRVVEKSLGKLTELERMAVLLVDIEQLEREEAGNAMGVQPTHLRVLLHRGRHKLRKALEDAGLQASA